MSIVREVVERAAAVAPEVGFIPSDRRTAALGAMAAAVEVSTAEIVRANSEDVARSRTEGLSESLVDRLTLTGARIEGMAAGLRAVAAQPDPVGEIVERWQRPNGLSVRRMRVPLGVVAVIYEARPNVTAEVAGLCLRSGNACVLRGSSVAMGSNRAIVEALRSALAGSQIPPDALQLVPDPSREAALELMRCKGLVDLLVPRGGQPLIESVEAEATVPYIIDGDGNCHVYVDRAADPEVATSIVVNAKTQRPSVCNAAETLLVHSDMSGWLTTCLEELAEGGVEIRGDERVASVWPEAKPATEEDWATEYLDLILAVKIVDSLEEAIAHVNRWGTSNAEAIVTQDEHAARRFVRAVDSGSIFVNASARFSDGGELGYGAEIGISTQKLHARGPLGARELTSLKYAVWGDGQVRT